MIEQCGTIAEETAHIGRGKNGRFAKGNKIAKGNPFTQRVANYRRTIMASVTEDDISAIISTLVFKAKTGDTAAAKLVLNYTVGHPQAFESPDLQIPVQATKLRLDNLETQLKMIAYVREMGGTPFASIAEDLYRKFVQITSQP